MFSGKRAGDILSTDAIAVFDRLGLREHLTPQRSNGFRSMVERIRADARGVLGRGGRKSFAPVRRRPLSVGERSLSRSHRMPWPAGC